MARGRLDTGMAMNRETPLERFRRACGLAEPLVLASRNAQSPDAPAVTLERAGPFLFIGRHPDDDLWLEDRQVSRHHAYLQAVAGRVLCIDLKSRTRTFWDDRAEDQPWGWLDPGQSLRIGPYRIERTDRQPGEPACRELADPFASPTGGESDVDGLPRPLLELPIRVGGVAPTWRMRGLLALVGRADDCQLTLADDSISRTHACLVRTPLGAWVVDLGVREGVHVNGTRVRWAWLDDGDLVRFGLFTMVVRYDRRPDGIVRQDVPVEAGAFPSEPPGDRPRGGPASSEDPGTELAIRSQPQPPVLRRGSGPPQVVAPAGPPAGGGEWEPALGPGANTYAIWQQQMQLMETFHNDMAMMVQMFVAMHREFQSSVREELARVQQLTRELGRLNARLGQIPQREQAGTAAEAARAEPKARAAPPGPKPRGAPTRPRPNFRARNARRRRDPPDGPPTSPPAARRPRPARRPGWKPLKCMPS